jgi:hypothetical protein
LTRRRSNLQVQQAALTDLLFPDQPLLDIDFDGNGFGGHSQILDGPCMQITRLRSFEVAGSTLLI